MQNDYSDDDIRIPAFLVPLNYAKTLKDDHEDIILNIGWFSEASKSARPILELWISSPISLHLSESSSLISYLSQNTEEYDLELHLMTSSCKYCSASIKQKYCISNGAYCLIEEKNGRQ